MNKNGNIIRVIVIILVLVSPALFIRGLSSVIDAPYLQPLALSQEALAAAGEGQNRGGFSQIDVQVEWGDDWPGTMTQAKLREVIEATLANQTEFYHFNFKDRPGTRVDITFIVGPNRYGPYPPGQMVTGIHAALIALRMTNGQQG